MSKAKELLTLLQLEEKLLRQRKFADLEKIALAKEKLSNGVEGAASAEMLEDIRLQANENAKLFSVILAAAKGLRARFVELGQASGAVAYTQNGARLSCYEEKQSRRV